MPLPALCDILNIAAVHPLRKGTLKTLRLRQGASWQLIDNLVARGELSLTEYRGQWFYLRRPKPQRPQGMS